MNNCYLDGCPQGTKIKDDNLTLSYKICQLINNLPYIIVKTGELVDFCPISEILEKICKINYFFENNLQGITNNIEKIIYNNSLLENEEGLIYGNNITYQITTTKSKYKYKNISNIDFGECENILKNHYKIDYLLILKFDIKINDTTPSKVEYIVYDPKTKEKLNLSICHNKIKIESPLILDNYTLDLYKNLTELGYNIYNKYDSFYYNICNLFQLKF